MMTTESTSRSALGEMGRGALQIINAILMTLPCGVARGQRRWLANFVTGAAIFAVLFGTAQVYGRNNPLYWWAVLGGTAVMIFAYWVGMELRPTTKASLFWGEVVRVVTARAMIRTCGWPSAG